MTVIHADRNWNTTARAILREAAGKWTRASKRRVEVEFDMDPSVPGQNVLATWVTSGSSLVDALDVQFAPTIPVAANIRMESGITLVVFILDRIEPAHFESVVTHEFGHVLGIPDLPTPGAIMTGVEALGDPVPSELTPADLDLCRSLGVCG